MDKQLVTPVEVRASYEDIARAYQDAFSGDPWYEKSKCIDARQRCIGGLSSTAVGQVCQVCNLSPQNIAYEYDELVARFDRLASNKEVGWYIERQDSAIALAACAWKTNGKDLVKERYSDDEAMQVWLKNKFADDSFTYLDEIFAQKAVRPSGNLHNFKGIVIDLTDLLNTKQFCFRTINPALVRAAVRDFQEQTQIFQRNKDVPDRRDFVIINVEDIKS